MRYKDRNGIEYEFRPTAYNIIRAEKRCGERLLSGIFAAATAINDAEMADQLFGTTERFCSVLYECSVKPQAQQTLTFELFCDSFDMGGLIGLMAEVTEALFASLAPPGGSIAPPAEDGSKDEKKSEAGMPVISGT